MSNRLRDQTSPYLLQHADNPVDWHPWNAEALEKAERENKPILLSIGYSACHWCHVMAHESFEDPDTAELMNRLYVNIKVDREERPDLDKIYQLAHQVLNQRGGGWPLTMVLTPEDRTPFFAGTYFPREPRYGMPGFKEVLTRVEAFFREHRADVDKQNTSLREVLAGTNPSGDAEPGQLGPAPLDEARRALESEFDPHYGGFGAAPKFPHPTNIERVLRHWAATATEAGVEPDSKALDMARYTLHAMASGGIYDQLGGGFCRYTVDERWSIPHFEKMLYDNGPLLQLYVAAWQATGEPVYRRVAEETAAWVMREMQSPEGGYYSTLDADSEGEEGKFYVWTPDKARQHLDAHEYTVAAAFYGLDAPANFEGKWHLRVSASLQEAAEQAGVSEEAAAELLQSAREKLFRVREQRIRPGRDEKILTAWNGLMIKGMAAAGRAFGRADLIASAERALDFVRETLHRGGRLLATYKDEHAHLNAYLDDYAFMIDGILELLQARWRKGDLRFAIALADSILEHFEDRELGGFFFTADDHEDLIHRPKPTFDDATPSGNGIAAYVLGRLGHLLGETKYLDASERALNNAWKSISQIPHAHGALLLALEEFLYPPQTVVLRGEPAALEPWLSRCHSAYAPRRMALAIPANETDLPGLLAERRPQGKALAYVCSGTSCQAPVSDFAALEQALATAEARM